MSGITSIALMGLFAWSGTTGTTTWSNPAPVPTPPAIIIPKGPTLTVQVTGYNAVPEQTDGNPDVTASGAASNPNVIAARSRDLADELPFGTVVKFEKAQGSNECGFNAVEHLIGYRVIADAMHERMHNKVDILFDGSDTVEVGVNGENRRATNPALALGVCDVSIRVVGKIAVKDIPATQEALTLLLSHTLAVR